VIEEVKLPEEYVKQFEEARKVIEEFKRVAIPPPGMQTV